MSVTQHGWSPSRNRLAAGMVAAVAGPVLVALVLLPFRGRVDASTVGLVMLVPTVLAAALGGPVAAVVAVSAGGLTHNAVFTVPYGTLHMTDPDEIMGLAVHTLVAAAVSLVVVREQRATRLAAMRGEAADRLRMLEEVDRLRTALLGAVSHDLRTPLAAIAAAASDLRQSDVGFDEDQQQVLLQTIEERCRVLDRMVAQLLDASRLHGGAVAVHAEAVEVEDLTDEAVTLCGEQATGRVRLRLGPATPPVLVDPVLIVTALRNLLENALRYAPADTEVVIDAAKAGDVVVIAVTDEGPGLSPAAADALFEPFGPGATGVGLGLSLVRGFVQLHGGEIVHHPAEGGGTVFEFTLPAVAEPAA